MKIGFIGGGNMAESFIAAFNVPSIIVSDINEERLKFLKDNYRVETTKDNLEVVKACEIIFLAVKPQVLTSVLKEIAPVLKDSQVVVSMAAGYPIRKMEEILGSDKRIIRIMPNILVKIKKGITAICNNKNVKEDDLEKVKDLLSSCGEVVEAGEKLFDGITALSGSGPAFIFLVIEALADGGVKIGLPRELALKLALETIIGSCEMVKSGEHPEVLKDKVTSPAGTTIAGLYALEENRARYAFIKALEKAFERSCEISSLIEKM